jgi:hypothetical protein
MLFKHYSLKIKKIILSILLPLVASLILFWKLIMKLILPLIASDMSATGMKFRGISFGNLIKIPVTIFQFIFGYEVNPLQGYFFIILFVIILSLLIVGLYKLYKSKDSIFYFILYAGILPLLIMFLLIEPLTLPGSTQFESKHALFFMPFLLLTINSSKFIIKSSLLFVVSICLVIGLSQCLNQDNYINWNKVVKLAKKADLIIPDGISYQSFCFYNNSKKSTLNIYDFNKSNIYLDTVNSIALILNDHKSYQLYNTEQMWNTGNNSQERNSVLLLTLGRLKQNKYRLVSSYIDYPFCEFIFEKQKRVSNSKRFDFPDVYGFEYKDLKFPLTINGHSYLGLKRYQYLDTIYIDSSFHFFIASSKIKNDKPIFIENSINHSFDYYNLTNATHPYNLNFNRGIPSISEIVYKWQHTPLMSNSFKYPGSLQTFDADIYRFYPKINGSKLMIMDKNITLYKLISSE